MTRLLNSQQIEDMFSWFAKNNPEPQTELIYSSTFELLIAVMLSAQSTDKSVNKATTVLFAQANTPEAILYLGESSLKKHIQTIGLYNSKAINIIKTCQILAEEHQSTVPNTRDALQRLPGVGRKTANVVLNTAFQQPTMAVDTHIFRLSNRTGLAPGSTVLAVEKKLVRRIPQPYLLNAHHWLILHGRYTCTARSPQCSSCNIIHSCNFTGKKLL